MAIEFVHLRESDYDLVDSITDLEKEVHSGRGAGLNRFEIHSFIRYGRVYAVTEEDTVLGCCYFMKDFDNPGKVFLYGISIRASESGKNLAVDLLKSVLSDLKESSVRMAEVTVHPSNHKALRVYKERLGFHVINVGDDALYEDEDFLILRKTL